MRGKIFLAAAVVLAVLLGGYAWRTQAARQQAPAVYFKMAPVDPRAMLSGDYMELFYDLERSPEHWENGQAVVFYAAENGVVQTAPTDREVAIFPFESRLRLPHQFYFQEGTGTKYEGAVYAKMRQLPGGRFLIEALTDEKFNEIH